jgi:flavin reductase (DIM6/NTAB) family NADH-FMN oxidoreductase RutF
MQRSRRRRQRGVVSSVEAVRDDAVKLESFDQLVGRLDYPMFIVTVAGEGERDGCLVGFATQSSVDPPRFIVCLSDKNRTFRIAREADLMMVHLVPADALELAELFGSRTGDDVDKFERCRWSPGPASTPVLTDCPTRFAGRILERFSAGDHWAFVLEPFRARCGSEGVPLTFQRARALEPGHEA